MFIILNLMIILEMILGKGHLGTLEEMHNRNDIPGAQALHSQNEQSKNKNKHHGPGKPGAASSGINAGGNHSSRGRGDNNTHGGPKGGVFGPTGKASDKALAENVAAGRANNALTLGKLGDEVKAAAADAEAAGNQDTGNPTSDSKPGGGGLPPNSPLANANDAGEAAAADAAAGGASPAEAAAAGQEAAAAAAGAGPGGAPTPEEAAAAAAADEAAAAGAAAAAAAAQSSGAQAAAADDAAAAGAAASAAAQGANPKEQQEAADKAEQDAAAADAADNAAAAGATPEEQQAAADQAAQKKAGEQAAEKAAAAGASPEEQAAAAGQAEAAKAAEQEAEKDQAKEAAEEAAAQDKAADDAARDAEQAAADAAEAAAAAGASPEEQAAAAADAADEAADNAAGAEDENEDAEAEAAEAAGAAGAGGAGGAGEQAAADAAENGASPEEAQAAADDAAKEEAAQAAGDAAADGALAAGATPEEAQAAGEAAAAAARAAGLGGERTPNEGAAQAASDKAEKDAMADEKSDEEAAEKGEQAADQAMKGAEEDESEDANNEDLGVVDAVPDDADEVEINDGELNLPLKPFKKSKRSSDEYSSDEEDKMGDKLRNKVTADPIPSRLNKIKGNNGYYNIPESAKNLDIEEGHVVFPKSAKADREKDGKDTKGFKEHVNRGEIPELPLGETYYTKKIRGATMNVPSPKNKYSPTNILIGGKKCLDIKDAMKLIINRGRLNLTPWKDFSKLLRPVLNFKKAIDCLGKSPEECEDAPQKDFIYDKNGKPSVVFTPKLGTPEQVPYEELLTNSPNSSGEYGQKGMPNLHEGPEPTPKRSLNIARTGKDKPNSIEEAFIKRNIKKARKQKDTAAIVTQKNPFTYEPTKDRKGKKEDPLKPKEEPQPTGPTKLIELKETDLIKNGKVIGKKTKMVTARPGSLLPPPNNRDPCPRGMDMNNAVKSILYDNATKFSQTLGLEKKEFIDKTKKLSYPTLKTIFEYQCRKDDLNYQKIYAGAYKDLEFLFKNKVRPFAEILGSAIGMAQRRLNPQKPGVRKIIKKPSVITKGPKSVYIKKNGKNTKIVIKEKGPNALKGTIVRK